MQIRTRTLAWSAAGLLAVGTATGLTAPTLLQTAAQPGSTASSAPNQAAPSQLIPLITAPNYRAIVARNQGAVVGITTAGPIETATPQQFHFGGDEDGNPFGQFFRGLPSPRQHGVQHAQ